MRETFSEKVIARGRELPDREAVIFRREILTYGTLADRALIAAGFLAAAGVKKGDRVLFSAVSKPETVVAYLGVQYAGAVSVFIDKNSTMQHAADIYDEAGAVLFLSDMKKAELPGHIRCVSMKAVCRGSLEDAAHALADAGTGSAGSLPSADEVVAAHMPPDPEDLSEILFTTGTTGKPKGVMLSHRAVLSILTHTKEGIGIREDDRILIPLPLHHSYSLRVLRAALYGGSSVVLQNGLTFAREIEQNLDSHSCTAIAVVPVSMELLRAQMQDRFYEIMGRFRYIEVGAGSLTVEQRKRLSANLPDTEIRNTWGSSETGGALFINVSREADSPLHVTAIGKPLPDIRVYVLDENDSPIESSPEHTGRLALSGEMLMSGYWNQPELTAAALKNGMLLTNDIVYADEDGFIHMLGRSDDIINVGGEKVSPLDVENVACELPKISECACIGVPDTETGLGEVPVLFFASEEAVPAGEIRAYIAANTEKYNVPVHYVRIDALPRNRMQKLDRKALRSLWEEGAGDKDFGA